MLEGSQQGACRMPTPPCTGRGSSGFLVEVCWAQYSLPAGLPAWAMLVQAAVHWSKMISHAHALPRKAITSHTGHSPSSRQEENLTSFTQMKPVAEPQASKIRVSAKSRSVIFMLTVNYFSFIAYLLAVAAQALPGHSVLLCWGRQWQPPSQLLPRCLWRPPLPSLFLFTVSTV